MIDTHLHILPGIDDGLETIEEALALAKVTVQEGVQTAIATPHYHDLFPQRSATEIKERVNILQQIPNRRGVPLRLFAGHEALIKPGLVEDIQAGRLATLNGSRYLLLELWNNSWLPETEQVIFELRAFGVIPIITHPERNLAVRWDPYRLTILHQQAVLVQMTAGTLLGIWGRSIRHIAESLIKKKLIHCIASDAHGLRKWPPNAARGLQRAEELLDRIKVHKMAEACPLAITKKEVYSFASLSNIDLLKG